jgi:heat shock protein HslJ
MTTTRRVLPLAVLLGLAGCGGGGQPAAPGPPPVDVAGTTWELDQGVVDGAALRVPEGHRITLLVEGDQAGGTSACNGYGASWAADGERVTVAVVSGTEMGCAPAVMRAESTYLGALPEVTTLARAGDLLRLTGGGVDLRFAAQADVPAEALIGRTWELDTLVDGETVASRTGEPATLRLDEDGTVTGSTGCRGLSVSTS